MKPILSALLAATGTAAGYLVSQAANFGTYAVAVTILGTIVGYYVGDIIEEEQAASATPASK
jgi:hypothetical protein